MRRLLDAIRARRPHHVSGALAAAVLAAATLAAACPPPGPAPSGPGPSGAEPAAAVAVLEAAWDGGQSLGTGQIAGRVGVYRNGAPIPATVGMDLALYDSVDVRSGGTAAIGFDVGARVTLNEETAIVIRNPSIFAWIGKLWVHRFANATGRLDVHTKYAVVQEVGSQYLVDVEPSGVVRVSMLEGSVRVRPLAGVSWSPVIVTAERQVTVSRASRSDTLPISRGVIEAQPLVRRARELPPLTVRRAQRVVYVTVPDVVGRSIADAAATLRAAGLVIDTAFVTAPPRTRERPGVVLKQDPPAGTRVGRGSTVVLTAMRPGRAP